MYQKDLNKIFIQRKLNSMVPKRELICVLLYWGKTSPDLRTRLRRTIEANLPHYKSEVILDLSVTIETPQVMDMLLLKALCKEDFGHEL